MNNTKIMICAALSTLSINALASDNIDFNDFNLESNSDAKVVRDVNFYRELAAKEQSLTDAALAVRQRIDSGVSLKEDGTWKITPAKVPVQQRPTPIYRAPIKPSEQATQSKVEIGGISFSNDTTPSELSVLHIIGSVATLRLNNIDNSLRVGDVSQTGEMVKEVGAGYVVLQSHDYSTRRLEMDF